MAGLVILGALLTIAMALLVAARLKRRRVRQGMAHWHQERRSGALAWRIFQRRPRTLRLTDDREH